MLSPKSQLQTENLPSPEADANEESKVNVADGVSANMTPLNVMTNLRLQEVNQASAGSKSNRQSSMKDRELAKSFGASIP